MKYLKAAYKNESCTFSEFIPGYNKTILTMSDMINDHTRTIKRNQRLCGFGLLCLSYISLKELVYIVTLQKEIEELKKGE